MYGSGAGIGIIRNTILNLRATTLTVHWRAIRDEHRAVSFAEAARIPQMTLNAQHAATGQ